MMTRKEAMATLLTHARDEIIVAVYSMAFELVAQRPDHPLNYTSVGAMRLASSHGLGIALGRPDRKVIVFDGDGSLLMNLGTLVTIASVAPLNFYHFLSENRTYDVNGGHTVPGGETADFAGLAAAAGYRGAHAFSDKDEFAANLGGILAGPGPVFTSLRIVPRDQTKEAPTPADYPQLYTAKARALFRATVGGGD